MAEAHLDHPGDWRWYGGRPASVLGPCPHVGCPHDSARGIADGPDYEHYVLLQCDVASGCAGQCRGWMAEWPEGEGPGGIRWRVPQEWLQVDVRPAAVGDPVRACGPDCSSPDQAHQDPEPDWVGNIPVEHGESDYPVAGTGGWNGLYSEAPDMYCLCGHPNYLSCPMWPSGGIAGWTITSNPDGAAEIDGDPTARGC